MSDLSPELAELRRPLTVTVDGVFAEQLRTLADQLGWTLNGLLGHLVGDLSELASRGLLVSDDADEFGPADPSSCGTNVTVQRG